MNNSISAKQNEKNAFNRGVMHSFSKDKDSILWEIRHALGLNNRQSLNQRQHGYINLNPAERIAIENIFKKYGVLDIWGFE